MRFLFWLALILGACGGDDRGRDDDDDAGGRDSGSIALDGGPREVDGGPAIGDAGPRPRTDAGRPDDPDAVTRAGVIFGSCVPDDGIADFIQELWDDTVDFPGVDALVECIAAAGGGCAALETCAGIVVDRSGPCAPSCDGSVFTACDDPLRYRVDCGRFGLSCDLDRGCSEGTPSEPCDYETYVASCDAGGPLYCAGDTVARGPVCADHGMECAAGDFGEHVCRGTGGACLGKGSSPGEIFWDEGLECDGDILTACVNGGLATRDCTAVGPGFGCHTLFGRSFCGLGAECDPYTGSRTPTCDGPRVRFCNMGRLDTVDCTTLGFTTCDSRWGCTPTGFAP